MVKQFQNQQDYVSNCIHLWQLPSLEVIVPDEDKGEKRLEPMAKERTKSVKYLNIVTAKNSVHFPLLPA